MSTIIMSQCWPLQISPTAKAVLISLADNANDQGHCWPSLSTIAMRTCFSERAVQNGIKWLEEHGLVKANRSNGRHTTYVVTPNGFQPPQEMHGLVDANPSTSFTPEADAPPQQMRHTPAADAGDPRTTCVTPPQEVPTNRHRTVNEPSKNRQTGSAEKPKTTKPKTAPAMAEGFDRFWTVYPRKDGKQDALKAWQKIKPDEALQAKILQALEAVKQTQQWLKDGGQFIPHGATWLNKKRWQDEIGLAAVTPKQDHNPFAPRFAA